MGVRITSSNSNQRRKLRRRILIISNSYRRQIISKRKLPLTLLPPKQATQTVQVRYTFNGLNGDSFPGGFHLQNNATLLGSNNLALRNRTEEKIALLGINTRASLGDSCGWSVNASIEIANPSLDTSQNPSVVLVDLIRVVSHDTPINSCASVTSGSSVVNEVSFTTPTGYVIEKEPSYMDAAWHEASGIDKKISIVKEQYANYSGPGIGGSAAIIIDFYRNPQNLTAEQWMRTKDYPIDTSIPYTVSGIPGIRFSQGPGGQHNTDEIVLRHKNWIVHIANLYDTPTEVQIFNQLLTSITFAK